MRDGFTLEELRLHRVGNHCGCDDCPEPKLCVCGEDWVSVTHPPRPRYDGSRTLAVVAHNAWIDRCVTCGRPWWCER